MKIQLTVCAAAALACLPAVVSAQDASTPKVDQGAKMMMRSHDTMFAMAAARGGVAEVELSKLAAEKASDPDIKAFAQQMVGDHGKANEQLKGIAEKQNLTLPASMDAKHQAAYDTLKTKTGADFDKMYVEAMVKDHEQAVKAFQRESNTGKDDQLKGFASETLPVIQGHLEKIKGIQSKMGA
jgi:putative membrane protein